jgi:hypothetical protein
MDGTTLLNVEPAPAPDTAPEATFLGEVPMVREDCWREVPRLVHVERQSKSAIAGRWIWIARPSARFSVSRCGDRIIAMNGRTRCPAARGVPRAACGRRAVLGTDPRAVSDPRMVVDEFPGQLVQRVPH